MKGCIVCDTVVISEEDVSCSVVIGTLVGVFSVMWSELLMTSAIRCSLWSSVYECQEWSVHYHWVWYVVIFFILFF